ncbi:hypothetical protein [Thiohalocapsa halophila]|uniref:hypothetical protein n=1 Tax=Thiohalocapsa halophila TaxID=69359 RepID=UPI0019083179|nr:hypothetical protein [Thiohalocapsa halophila]
MDKRFEAGRQDMRELRGREKAAHVLPAGDLGLGDSVAQPLDLQLLRGGEATSKRLQKPEQRRPLMAIQSQLTCAP